MATLTFTADDLATSLPNLEPAELEIAARDALALALLAAPCLASDSLSDLQVMQAQAVIRGAAIRQYQDTSLAFHVNAGDFGLGPAGGTGQGESRRVSFYPSEEDKLRQICSGGERNRVFSGWVI